MQAYIEMTARREPHQPPSFPTDANARTSLEPSRQRLSALSMPHGEVLALASVGKLACARVEIELKRVPEGTCDVLRPVLVAGCRRIRALTSPVNAVGRRNRRTGSVEKITD